ncbi:MAG: A24 family peptidase [Bacillota bacterium]
MYIKIILMSVLLGFALYYDIKENKIKNIFTLPAAIAGIAVNAYENGFEGIIFSIKGWIVPIACLVFFYLINVMGAGDIKFFASIGSIMGLSFAGYSFVYSVYIGGIICIIILVRKGILISRIKYLFNYLKYTLYVGRITVYCLKESKRYKFPFSVAIVPGTSLQIIFTLLHQRGVTLNAGGVIGF